MAGTTEKLGQCACGAKGRVIKRHPSPTTRVYRFDIETENGDRHTVETVFDPDTEAYVQEHISP